MGQTFDDTEYEAFRLLFCFLFRGTFLIKQNKILSENKESIIRTTFLLQNYLQCPDPRLVPEKEHLENKRQLAISATD